MEKIDPGQWEAAIERLYDAVGHELPFAEALGAFRTFFDARGVIFLTTPERRLATTTHIGSAGVSPASLVEYHTHFNVHDEWVRSGVSRGFVLDRVYRGSQLVAPQALKRSYFWREFLHRHRIRDVLCCIVEPLGPDGQGTFLTFHRHEDQPLFPRRSEARLASLTPHLRRVLRLHRRLAPELAVGATLHELFRAADAPMLLVGEAGELVESNPAAAAAMELPDAVLKPVGGRLMMSTAEGWKPLADALAAFADEARPSLSVELHTPGRHAVLEIRRVHGATTDRFATHRAVAICTIAARPAGDGTDLARRYGLTPAELRVARRLCEGLSAAAIADEQQVGVTTVRTHIRNLFVKTGTSRQAQLVSRMMNGQ